MNRSQVICLFALVCAAWCVALPASGANDLMILVEKSPAGEGVFKYDFGFKISKDAATSCAITIGSQTYNCSQMEGEWFPEASFWEDNGSLTETALGILLADPWVITWNGGSSPTIAEITFGSTWIDDFPPQPTITGVDNDTPARGIVRWDANPGSIGISYFAVDVVNSQKISLGPTATDCSDWLDSTASECSFDLPADGYDLARVAKVHEGIGNIFTDVQIQQGSWDLGSVDGWWFAYWCIDQWPFQVWGGVQTQEVSWGFLKALYR